LFSIIAFWGKPGRGKSIIPEKTLGLIYGMNFVSLSQVEIDSPFTGPLARRQMVLVDEVDAADSRTLARALKKFSTQRALRINEKFVPSYEVQDHINFFLTSNSASAFNVDESDRRYFVHHVPDEPLAPSFFDHYVNQWIGLRPDGTVSGPGLPALLYYFQNELNYGDFDPHRPPPLTDAKREMTEVSRHPCEHWIRTFTELPVWAQSKNCEVWANATLHSLYRTSSRAAESMTTNWFGSHLTMAGLPKLQVKVKVKVEGRDVERACRLVAVTNFERWKKAQPHEWIAEFKRGQDALPPALKWE
jgi:hypothetical protein